MEPNCQLEAVEGDLAGGRSFVSWKPKTSEHQKHCIRQCEDEGMGSQRKCRQIICLDRSSLRDEQASIYTLAR